MTFQRTEAASVQQERVRLAVLAVAAAVEPDERYDPADDPRIAEALEQLRPLLGTASAEGVALALRELWCRWVLQKQ